MLRRHRNSVLIGVSAVVLAALYGGLAPLVGYHVEWAGVTMLVALGVALGLLVAVLEAGLGD